MRQLLPFGKLRLTSFLFAPPDLRTSDQSIAADIYAGQFAFAGRLVDTRGLSPFDVAPPSSGWADTLYGFGWLRHLHAANTALARENGRMLVRDFMAQTLPAAAVTPHVVCRRLNVFLSQSPLLLDGADHTFYMQYLAFVRDDAWRLRDALRASDDPLVLLNATISLTALGLCVEGAERLLGRFGREMSEQLDEQVLPDGGHVSRNPRVLIDLLLVLLPLRSTYAARGLEAPSGLVSAIDRIVPHLKMLRHPDGSIALFNGMGASQFDVLATIFASHDSGGRAATDAPYTGYQRLEAGQSVLIADTGPSPPFAASREAAAGCLSFEFSHERQRIFVNCGIPQSAGWSIPTEVRSTAAHTATTLGDTSTCRFLTRDGETRIIAGPKLLTAQRTTDLAGEHLVMSHDGYNALYGVETLRAVTLSVDGFSMSGSEAVNGSLSEPAHDMAMVTRFHLHPSVKAQHQPSGDVLLMAVRGSAWGFSCEGAALQLEDSVFFAAIDGARRTTQIVLTTRDMSRPITWTLRRQSV